MKDEKKIREVLRRNVVPPLDKNFYKIIVKNVLGELESKPLTFIKIAWIRRVFMQIPFLSKGTLFGQAVILLAGILIAMNGRDQRYLMVMSICIPLVGVVGGLEILRSFASGMWELEQTCRYDLRQVMGMKLFIIGITDLMSLGLWIVLGNIRGTGITHMLIFVLIPFNISNIVYLLILKIFGRNCSGFVFAAAGVGMSMVMTFMNQFFADLELYTKELSLFAGVLGSMASFVLMGILGYRFLNHLKEEEIVECSFN